MTTRKMLFVLIAQRGGDSAHVEGQEGQAVKSRMAAPLLHTNTQLYH